MIKSKNEIKLIKKACKISNSCLKIIEYSLKEKITEKELRKRIEKYIRKQGATLSFRTIVACGKRAAKIHPKPRATDKIIKGLGYVDFGACYKGYKSDITVPFIKGKISKKERKIVRATLHAYKIAIKSIKIGMPCYKLHEKVDSFLRKKGFRLYHSLGHGIGKKIHELPTIGKPNFRKKMSKKKLEKLKRKWEKIKKIKFQPGMVFTIEPGIYLKGFAGFRIENDVLLTENGIKVLTKSKLIEIG
ncbi:MAG: M24 family metallopeptidase [Candidatus Aenigmarchaeota archaeon]|nr:M24 family metallopeptidase [Candidatus Aenigmarchaeota archaeon]